MSTLAAARADNFYYPPEWDPTKGNLDKFNGQHPLRERAKKLDQGILVIRFEVPFNIWCDGCGELVGKGVRFNAEKQQIGTYLSSKIWSFGMHHHCGCRIEIVTDPKTAQYIVKNGAKQKDETYTSTDAQVLELPDADVKARMAADPIYKMERQLEMKQQAASGRDQISDLLEHQHHRAADSNGYKLNKELKRRLRNDKHRDAALDVRRQELGLHESIKLLPTSEEDARKAAGLFAEPRRKKRCSQQATRQHILAQDVFSKVHKKERRCDGLAPGGKAGQGGKNSVLDKAKRLAGKLKRSVQRSKRPD